MKNPADKRKFKKLISNPKRLEKELFVKTDSNGENINPSEQQRYPGPSKQPNIPSSIKKKPRK